MKVAVCLKNIPAPDGNIRLCSDGEQLDFSLVERVLNPLDEYALEAALRVRELGASSHLLALSVGSERNDVLLRRALAVGADEALRVEPRAPQGVEPQRPQRVEPGGTQRSPNCSGSLAARLAARKLKAFAPDLVFCGGRAMDDEEAFFPAALAEWLDYAHVSGVCAVDQVEGGQLVCRRRADTGEQEVKVRLPAVISCDRMSHELRVPTLKSRMASKKRPIRITRPEDADLREEEGPALRSTFHLSPDRAPRKVWTTYGEGVAGELLRMLRSEEGLES
jgi:electron transfer flavoprotein beta subunit